MTANLADLSLNDLVEMAAQRSTEMQALQTNITRLGDAASHENIVQLHDSAVGFIAISQYMLTRAEARQQPMTAPEQQQVTYLMTNTPMLIKRTQRYVGLLREHFPTLMAS